MTDPITDLPSVIRRLPFLKYASLETTSLRFRDSTDRAILLAECRDGKPLAAPTGPLRVVVPGEKRHSRWVRQVVTLKVGKA